MDDVPAALAVLVEAVDGAVVEDVDGEPCVTILLNHPAFHGWHARLSVPFMAPASEAPGGWSVGWRHENTQHDPERAD